MRNPRVHLLFTPFDRNAPLLRHSRTIVSLIYLSLLYVLTYSNKIVRIISCTSAAPLRTRVRVYCVPMCVCRGPAVTASLPLPRIDREPPPSLPGAHVCGTPTARILFRSWAATISDSHCYVAKGGASGGTPTDPNNADNVVSGYYAIFVINAIQLLAASILCQRYAECKISVA